ncbi:5-formyltetrahydrofolate cyclo-ligase [Pseudooceanicola sp. CBS1P-1]|uniref:5-formyltetrahydrofolate cyclo-ligase n=1 Tax=Pseudooceanicola albus TaxID=2692189 RepID=A0A6L7G4D2_9RHOB|nr:MULTISPECIES: 5-formyltetrahydrofolate cyclo-ligase [Pseudooceanicola]MBT9384686.1 5-formyltetrahydrofolate cyclo-ligase [Pseudooceanicola endophyticus]MXN18387.1 5-formyltetrahydrofolate cyclo-ligase [Pseudooceanicola albus]
MSDLVALKGAARKAAFARRAAAHAAAGPGRAGMLSSVLAGYRGVPLAGYWPIRTEIPPTAALEEAAAHGPVGLPVILGPGQPLRFALWEPGCEMVAGEYGAHVPARLEWMVPEIVIVPLVAFDRRGGRLGYGGGFYDRTLEALRAQRATLAVGYAYGAQEAEELPLEATDQPLDLIVTEREVIVPGALPG